MVTFAWTSMVQSVDDKSLIARKIICHAGAVEAFRTGPYILLTKIIDIGIN